MRCRVGRGTRRPCQLLWLLMGQGGPWTHHKSPFDAAKCPQPWPWLPAPHPPLSSPPSPASQRPTEATPDASVQPPRLCPGGPHLFISLLHEDITCTRTALNVEGPAQGTTHIRPSAVPPVLGRNTFPASHTVSFPQEGNAILTSEQTPGLVLHTHRIAPSVSGSFGPA